MITCTSLLLGLHLVSYHEDHKPYTNNVNPGVYAECDGWTAGAFKNSLSRSSVYAGYTFRHEPFALSLGVTSGYERREGPCRPGYKNSKDNPCTVGLVDGKILPMLTPSVVFGGARLWLVPKHKGSSTAIHLSYEWRVNP
jgi:hypothetical protein